MMKCPNCGKEALFVNGKYVCVDCGIEITPEQQGIQNQFNEQPVEPSGMESDNSVVKPVIDTNESVQTNLAESAPESKIEPTQELPTPEKPVQQYYEATLEKEDVSQQEEAHPGVYDFSNNQAVSELVQPEPVNDIPEMGSSASPSESTLDLAEPKVASLGGDQSTAMVSDESPKTYFEPTAFDMNNTQTEETAVPEVTEPQTNPVIQEEIAPSDVPAPETLIPQEPEIQPVATVEPISLVQDNPTNLQPKTLDEMLGEPTPGSESIASSPISAYGAGVEKSDTVAVNVAKESPMPSVESVFGDVKPPIDKGTDMPTAQDFGVAPKPQPDKKRKIMPFVLAGVGAFVLITAVTVVAILGSRSNDSQPVELTESDINILSNETSIAMQQPRGLSVDYNYKADYSSLLVKEEAKDAKSLENFFAKPLEVTGTWYTDTDGDITVESKKAEVVDKRTYISKDLATQIYSEKSKKYTKSSGLQISNIFPFFGVEEKAALFYATNIKKATLVGTEIIEEVSYSKYQIIPSEQSVANGLDVLGSPFMDAEYQSLNADNLIIYALVGSDKTIKKITYSGDISVETTSFNGKISLSGEATYTYQEISIIDPTASPGAVKETETPVSDASGATSKEEGETSSIDSRINKSSTEDNPYLDAKG